MLPALRSRYDLVSKRLAARDDREVARLLDAGDEGGSAGPTVLDVGGVAVFAKRVPLTDRELARPLSKANLFELPMFCQYFFGMPRFTTYGFGGPAINGWRELAANQIITDAALQGQPTPFPLLYHWRVLPIHAPITATDADVEAVVDALDGSEKVRSRLEALRAASQSLVLFFEHIPDPIAGWLEADPAGRASTLEQQLLQTVHRLRELELLHMDGNFDNMRTDGQRLYFVDFGLATSPQFDLSPAEREFVDRNTWHDVNYASMRLAHWAATSMCGVTVSATGDRTARSEFIRRCAEDGVPDGLPPAAAQMLARHASVAKTSNRFYHRLFDGELALEYPAELTRQGI